MNLLSVNFTEQENMHKNPPIALTCRPTLRKAAFMQTGKTTSRYNQ